MLLVEWSLIEGLLFADPIYSLASIGAASRAPMGLAMAFIPNARKEGLSSTVGVPSPLTALLGLGLATAISVVLLPIPLGALLIFGALFGASIIYFIAWQKIGGQTGDVLGASQKIASLFAFLALYLFG